MQRYVARWVADNGLAAAVSCNRLAAYESGDRVNSIANVMNCKVAIRAADGHRVVAGGGNGAVVIGAVDLDQTSATI